MDSGQQCVLGLGLGPTPELGSKCRLELGLKLLPRVKLLPESQAAFCWTLLRSVTSELSRAYRKQRQGTSMVVWVPTPPLVTDHSSVSYLGRVREREHKP